MVIGFRLYVFLVHVPFCVHFHAVEGDFLVAVVFFGFFPLFFTCHFANGDFSRLPSKSEWIFWDFLPKNVKI